jgi:hypothetical protein
MITRREFLAMSSVSIGAGLARRASDEHRAFAPIDRLAHERPWYAAMRRCGQININERDALDMDVDAWIDYWASLKVDALLLNGGGIVAYYPTEVPYHHRSEFLGSRDLFGEVVAATRAQGIRVVARMDCNYAYEPAVKAHPEWFEREKDGSLRPHGESTWLFKTCMFSPYFTEHMPAIYREINRRYQVDGFFTNGWPSAGALTVCYCDACRELYTTKVGGVPPADTDATSVLYRKYYDAFMDRVIEVWKQWDGVAKEGARDSVYVGNLGGGIRTVKDMWRIGQTAGWFNADHQGRAGNTPIWDCSLQGRVAAAMMKGRTATNVTGAYANTQPLWRHTSKSPAEATLWMAQTTASGMVPWYHWLGASPEDTRWRETGRAFFRWLADNEPHFRNRSSIADVAVLYPQRTIAFYRSGGGPNAWSGADRARTTEYLQGLYYALLEARVLIDFVAEEDLSEETLRKYRVLILPNAAYLSDRHVQQIREYAGRGGSILATFETSRYDEWGDRREDFALADLFGAHAAGEVSPPHDNSYMRIAQPHPVVDGFDGTALVPGADERVPIRAADSGPLVLTVVPPYPAFPPEMVFPREPRTSEPAAVFRWHGDGRVAYFAGDVDRTFWRSTNTDLARLIGNTVRWLRGDRQPLLTIEGDGVIEAFAWETEPGVALHLVNYTNPNMMGGWVRQFYPTSPLRVQLAAPTGRAVRRGRALRAGREVALTVQGDRLRFETPPVADYEVIALT